MSVLEFTDAGAGQLFLNEEQAREAGRKRADSYREASPFPHIVIDDFVSGDVLQKVIAEFPQPDAGLTFARAQEQKKTQYHPKDCGPFTRQLLNELNSQAFLAFLQEMTGMKGLVADPYFTGGGLHETKNGGHLGVHADFNMHPKMKLQRRINLLIYLNENWDDSFGGHLELWDTEMKACQTKVSPVFGRAVMFNTDLDSYHGHPDPLACPPDRSRRSIATYYYTAYEGSEALAPKRTTAFKARPGTDDKPDLSVKLRHLMLDWTPPALHRKLSSLKSSKPAE
ncbi:2OG-Fe(II) oxygenase [Porphyrobacter sp. YT40]|uniref:2OG-Fe(II) oxygenase n=1 Tax=Porphyrobacter sp. YT40 TaxID=2547601 RepID=UPI00114249E6|nr:2OG-Fe(II) oxygenase [Porphyrobacter sp. YT40]QDH33876.1 2OG-Fe(II) oxygenase [Porphyrobacter sp. YT40]